MLRPANTPEASRSAREGPKLAQASVNLGPARARAAVGVILLDGHTRRGFDMGRAHHIARLRHVAHLEHLLVPEAGVQVEDAQLGQGGPAHRGKMPAGPCGEREARERAREADGNPHNLCAAGGEAAANQARDRK